MKTGKISDNVLKRTILKSIGKNPAGCVKPSAGKDAAYLTSVSENTDVFVMGMSTVVGENVGDILKAIFVSSNNVLAAGCVPQAIVLNITLPEATEEAELRRYMEAAYETAKSMNMGIIGGHTEVSEYVTKPVFSVICSSGLSHGKMKTKEKNKAYDIVMTGYAGYEGAAEIFNMCEDEYAKIFTAEYLKDVRDALFRLSIEKEAAVAIQHGVTAMHDIHTCGVFGALWELGEQIKSGFTIDIRKIPVKQSTIEVCERVEVNPYELSSVGALLMVTEDGEGLVEKLRAQNLQAEIIGNVSDNNERVLLNKGEKRFLDKPGIDELYRIKKLKEDSQLCVRKF